MKLVEVHILQTVAPSNLNRDDTNSPKDALFGGFRRARISSQAQKRAVRNSFRKRELFTEEELALRSRLFVEQFLLPRLKSGGYPEDQALKASKAAFDLLKRSEGESLFEKEGKKETTKMKYILFLGYRELEKLIEFIMDNFDSLITGKKKKELSKSLQKILNGGRAVDVALFGRMLADRPEFNVEAAVQMAHAISTHKVDREFDFYTAVDDLNPEEETGAGMMGDVEFYSATLYRYAVVDLDKLIENLQKDKKLAVKGLRAFLEAFILTLPSGKQNSFAAHNPPLFVALRAGVGLPRDLATAFEKPVRPQEGKPLSALSVEALLAEWVKFDRYYGALNHEWKGLLDLTGVVGSDWPKVKNLRELLNKTEEVAQKLLVSEE